VARRPDPSLRFLALRAAAALAAAALACQTAAPTAAPQAALSLGSTSSAEPLLAALAEAYPGQSGGVTFAVEVASGQLALDGLRAGRYQAVLVGLPGAPPPEDLWAQPVALDGLAVIVHRDNPLAGLTVEELRAIFEGRTNAWSRPGAANVPIEVVSREERAEARALFESGVMGGRKVTLTAVVLPGSREVRDYVAQHPGAIGYVSLGWLDGGVSAVPLGGVAPSPETVAAQQYPLVTPIYFVSAGEPQGELRAFYRFVISAEGQEVVRRRYGPVQ
jgi:phosphate transport system substrate-binding protein